MLTYHSQCPRFDHSKPNIMTNTSNLSTQEVETVGLGVQGHLWQHKKFEASLGSTRHRLNVHSLLPQKELKVILRCPGTWRPSWEDKPS